MHVYSVSIVYALQVVREAEKGFEAVDYRLAPETRFPGPLHDAVTAYFRLVDDLKIPPENIVVAGDSAGGGLTLALLMYLRDNNYPLPSGTILFSPWVGEFSRTHHRPLLEQLMPRFRSHDELRIVGQQRPIRHRADAAAGRPSEPNLLLSRGTYGEVLDASLRKPALRRL